MLTSVLQMTSDRPLAGNLDVESGNTPRRTRFLQLVDLDCEYCRRRYQDRSEVDPVLPELIGRADDCLAARFGRRSLTS